MMKQKSGDLLAILLLIGVMLVVFWPLLTGGVILSTGVTYSDMWMFNYPLKDWYREMLLEGRLPFWTSLVGNGFPVFAELQIGALYPFNLLFYWLLPTALAFNLNVIAHFILAAVFMYWLARISLALSPEAAFLSGLTYALSGFFLVHIHQINILLVVAYLPLVFFCIERMIRTGKVFWVFVLAIVFGLQILAGYIEMFYYTVLLGFGFLIFTAFLFPEKLTKKTNQIWLVAGYSIAVLLGVGGSALQILPTWELTQVSQRSEGVGFEHASATKWPIETLSFFVNPKGYQTYVPKEIYDPGVSEFVANRDIHGYIGILSLALAFAAVMVRRKRMVVVFAIMVFLAFLYGFGKSTQIFVILWELVPGLKYFRYPIKILFFIEFCLAILAGFGFDAIRDKLLLRKINPRSIRLVGFLVLLVIFGDLYFNNVKRLNQVVSGEAWSATPELVEFLQRKMDDKNFRLYSHGTNNIDYSLSDNFDMQKQFQNILPVDYSMIHRIPANREWFALLLERQTKLNGERTILDPDKGVLRLSETFKKSLALQSVKFLVADLPIEDDDLALIKKIDFSREVGHEAFFPGVGEMVKKVVPAKATHLYEYDKAYPRARFVSASRFVMNADAAREAVLGADFDATKEVILEEEVKWGGAAAEGEAKVIEDKETELMTYTKSQGDGWLVLADTYYPGWKAEVDGKETKIYRANYAFRAIEIPAGEHQVRFYFEPSQWQIGKLFSGASLLITAGGLLLSAILKLRF